MSFPILLMSKIVVGKYRCYVYFICFSKPIKSLDIEKKVTRAVWLNENYLTLTI